MKKLKLLSVLLIIAILINIISVNAFALVPDEQETIIGTQIYNIYQTDNFASYYFYNLHNNFSYNIADSCGYVAIGMLLSFYDIYWNPSFIPGYYLQKTNTQLPFGEYTQSPGIISDYEIANILDPLDPGSGPTMTEYFNYVKNHSNDYFHFYLMNIGIERRYAFAESGGFFLFSDQLESILNYYLMYEINDSYLMNSVSVVDCTQSSDNATKAKIAELIDDGIPVILTGSGTPGSHAMIAYDYSTDADGNIELYVHMGYSTMPYATHVKLSTTAYTADLEAYYINVTSAHVCSEPYIVDGAEVDFCSCSFGMHPNHIHDYEFIAYNATKHKKVCTLCGTYSLLAHVITFGGTTCVKCGAIVSSNGPIKVNGNNGSNYLMNVGTSPYVTEYITENGSYVLSNGIVVLTDVDMNNYLNGYLDISEYTS